MVYAEERQQAMARLVAERGKVSVNGLAERYAIATETVRRDLSVLERMGLVRRVHGGAVAPNGSTVIESRVIERDCANAAEKERIARAAVALLPPEGSILMIDAGSTTLRLASMLPRDRPLAVFTRSVPIAALLSGHPRLELHLLPGLVRPTETAAAGADTVAALDQLRVDSAFLSTHALSLGHGLSTPDHADAVTKRAIVHSARQVIVLCDASKLGQESTVRFADISEVDVLVTDGRIGDAERSSLVEAGVDVVIA